MTEHSRPPQRPDHGLEHGHGHGHYFGQPILVNDYFTIPVHSHIATHASAATAATANIATTVATTTPIHPSHHYFNPNIFPSSSPSGSQSPSDVRVYRVWLDPPDLSGGHSITPTAEYSLTTANNHPDLGQMSPMSSSVSPSHPTLSPFPTYDFTNPFVSPVIYYNPSPSIDGIGESTLNLNCLMNEESLLVSNDGLVSPPDEQLLSDIPHTTLPRNIVPSSIYVPEQPYFSSSPPSSGNPSLFSPSIEESDNDIIQSDDDYEQSTPTRYNLTPPPVFYQHEVILPTRANASFNAAAIALEVDIPVSPTNIQSTPPSTPSIMRIEQDNSLLPQPVKIKNPVGRPKGKRLSSTSSIKKVRRSSSTTIKPKFPPTIVRSKINSGSRKSRTSLPGPIPATVPTFVRKDETGTDWISFQYSRKRVRSTYCIRCDVESVEISQLTPQFKADNCIYPRAAVPPEQYKGNRQKYESECNCIGWCLAYLNPELANRRGLIQRAVDSWRNTNSDPALRSRRVRKMSKDDLLIQPELTAEKKV